MSPIPFIPDTAPFTPEQRAWLNGFLAGLFAQVPPDQVPGAQPAPAGGPPASGKPLLILFGSQTGTAEGLAKKLTREAAQRGFAPTLSPLNACELASLAAGGTMVILSSTWGEGDPPDNAVQFWNRLNSETAPRLENLQFAVLGLGDRNYSDFCGASRKLDARLEALGARRLIPRGECDVDYEQAAGSWMSSLWEKLIGADGSAAPPPGGSGAREAVVLAAASLGPETSFGKANPFPARLLRNVLLNKPGSTKEVRHYEISLAGSGLTYEAGDALGVVPVNCPELVDEMIAALRSDPDEPVALGKSTVTLREALARHLDITRPSQELFTTVANAAPASDLAALLALEKREELKQWLYGRGVIDLLHLLAEPPPALDFVKLLRRLTPRLYSIASSPNEHPGEAHLTVNALRYQSHGRGRKGVASTFLADRVGDADFVKVFVQPSPGFKLPAGGDVPIIMIGPGTGIAPFRAFLEERKAAGAKGRNWLFFGEQRRGTDFLYEDQLTAWRKDGLLTRLETAFSRDQAEKVYVQHRMTEHATELWAWLEEGAHIYVCGDAARMAKDVDAALHQIIQTAGGRNTEQAQAYVADLRSGKRYQRDVY